MLRDADCRKRVVKVVISHKTQPRPDISSGRNCGEGKPFER